MIDLDYSPIKVVDTEGMPNDVWLNYRRLGLGGSDVSVLFQLNPWTTRRSLYYDKIGLPKGEPDNQYTLDFGHAIEPFVAQWFQKGYNTKPEKYRKWLEIQLHTKLKSFRIYKDTWMYRHPLHPCLQADLDYRFEAVSITGKVLTGIFECKTTNPNDFKDKWGWNKVPEYYTMQCREYMCVMNQEYTIIACVCGNNEDGYAMGFVNRDLETEEELIETAEDFWYNNVQAKNLPDRSDEEHADKEMDTLLTFGLVNGDNTDADPIVLPGSAAKEISTMTELSTRISALEKEAKKLKAQKTLCEAELMTQLKNHSKGTVYTDDTQYDLQVSVTHTHRLDSGLIEIRCPKIKELYGKITDSVKLKIKSSQATKTA